MGKIVFFNNRMHSDDYYPMEGKAFDVGEKSKFASPYSQYDTYKKFKKMYVPAEKIAETYSKWFDLNVKEDLDGFNEEFDKIYQSYSTNDTIYLGIDGEDRPDGYWHIIEEKLQRRLVKQRVREYLDSIGVKPSGKLL